MALVAVQPVSSCEATKAPVFPSRSSARVTGTPMHSGVS
jgi:hypothetical protein